MSVYNVQGEVVSGIYNLTGDRVSNAYDVFGNRVYIEETDYDNYTITDYINLSVGNAQGFDIHNGYIFQFIAGDKMNVYNVETASAVATDVFIESDHGDSASFSNDFYSASDEFPLIYVTADTNPAKIYINQVTTSSSVLIRTLSFSIAQAGYYAAVAVDFDNQILYMVGYTEQAYLSDNGGSNKVLISKWDLSSLTDNGNGTFTPAYISSTTRDFIYCMQGQQYHDGLIWIASGYTNHAGYIYAVDPSDGNIAHTVNLNTSYEVEGLAWVGNDMIVNYQGKNYQKVVFG